MKDQDLAGVLSQNAHSTISDAADAHQAGVSLATGAFNLINQIKHFEAVRLDKELPPDEEAPAPAANDSLIELF